jgi:hypothetical protein
MKDYMKTSAERSAEYREKHRKLILERRAKYRAENKEAISEYRKKWHASKKPFKIKLTKEEAESKYAEQRRKTKAEDCKNLADTYVAKVMGLSTASCTKELLAFKREQLSISRLLKTFESKLKEQ